MHFSLAYLVAAEACAKAYIDWYENQDLRGSGWEAYPHLAFIPAFWNIKHAFELTTKYLLIRQDPSRKEYNHDLKYCLAIFQKELKLNNEKLEDLDNIFDKYNNLRLLEPIFQSQKLNTPKDSENQFFHYPDGHSVHADYKELWYYSLDSHNGELMYKIMLELIEDAKKFVHIFSKFV